MDKNRERDIRRAASKYLDWEEIYPTFYLRFENELKLNGFSISERYVEPEVGTNEKDPDVNELYLGIVVVGDTESQEEYDVRFDQGQTVPGFEAMHWDRETGTTDSKHQRRPQKQNRRFKGFPSDVVWEGGTANIETGNINDHIDELIKQLKEGEKIIEKYYYNKYGPA